MNKETKLFDWSTVASEMMLRNGFNADEFKQTHLCEFKPDERFNQICDRLCAYHTAADKADGKSVMGHWRAFQGWCDKNGYGREDISRAKKSQQVHRHLCGIEKGTRYERR